MSDGTPTRRRGLTKTHKRVLGATGSIVVVVLVFVFILPRIADYRSVLDVVRDLDWQDWALMAGAVVLNLSTFPPAWMAALPGLDTRRDGDDAGIDGARSSHRRARRSAWCVVFDAAIVEVPGERRRAGGRDRRSLEPAREPRLSCRRARAAHAGRRGQPGSADCRAHRIRRPRRRDHRVRARSVSRGARSPDRGPRRARRESRAATCPARSGRLGR